MQIQITLNGKQAPCESGQTILQVANANGAAILTLCHDELRVPFGYCLAKSKFFAKNVKIITLNK